MGFKEEAIKEIKKAGFNKDLEESLIKEIEDIDSLEDSLEKRKKRPRMGKKSGSINHRKRRIKSIKSAEAQPCVRCPATSMITFQCWNCELFISGYRNGDIKCGYPFETPLDMKLFGIETDPTRWDAKYHLRKQGLVYGHPALYEFGEIYESQIGRVWDTWVRDKSKLKEADIR